tara:strand:- start:370 stop:576 length:207 start_codon:yes stop_codon:yes gene_type:complete
MEEQLFLLWIHPLLTKESANRYKTLRAGTPFKFHLNKEKNAMIFDNATPFAFVELKIMAESEPTSICL